MKQQQQIVFLNSYSPRTGHNFSSEVLKLFSDHQVLVHNKSETKLSRVLDNYFHFRDRIIHHNSDREFLDSLLIKGLRERILNHSENNFVMLKDTSIIGAEKLLNLFPDDLHIILIRDPETVFQSLFKAMNLENTSFRNLLKKIGIFTGLYPYYYSRKISRKVLKYLPELDNFHVLKYEDLVIKKRDTLLFLMEIFKTEKDLEQIKTEIDEIPVINSSFYEEVGANHIWEKKLKNSNFNPLNRKGSSYLLRKGIELGSKPLRKILNYV